MYALARSTHWWQVCGMIFEPLQSAAARRSRMHGCVPFTSGGIFFTDAVRSTPNYYGDYTVLVLLSQLL